MAELEAHYGVHHTGELRQDVVPRRVHDPTSILLDKTCEGRAISGNGAHSRLFVLSHERAVTLYIGA
jgi:hypothetical protein